MRTTTGEQPKMPIVPQAATATTVTTAVDDDGGDSAGASSKDNRAEGTEEASEGDSELSITLSEARAKITSLIAARDREDAVQRCSVAGERQRT
jgi:hypothetical protein